MLFLESKCETFSVVQISCCSVPKTLKRIRRLTNEPSFCVGLLSEVLLLVTHPLQVPLITVWGFGQASQPTLLSFECWGPAGTYKRNTFFKDRWKRASGSLSYLVKDYSVQNK